MEGHLPWERLGDFDVRVLQVYRIEPAPPAPDDVAVRAALLRVLRLAAHPDECSEAEGYACGVAAYDLWASSLEAGIAVRDGHAYNAAYGERHVVDTLLGAEAIRRAAAHEREGVEQASRALAVANTEALSQNQTAKA